MDQTERNAKSTEKFKSDMVYGASAMAGQVGPAALVCTDVGEVIRNRYLIIN